MNYAELTQAIQDYTENAEATFVSNIPVFVRQCEERIYRAVLIPDLKKSATGSTTASNRYLLKPSDHLATFSIAVIDGSGDYTFLMRKDLNFIREAYPSVSTEGLPVNYASFDDTSFILGPTPDATYTVEMSYFYDPESIVTASTSWLGDNAESALLYGCLIEAYTFMKGEADILAKYTEQYDMAIKQLTILSTAHEKRDSYRDGDIRMEL
jgi:hypothetical protein